MQHIAKIKIPILGVYNCIWRLKWAHYAYFWHFLHPCWRPVVNINWIFIQLKIRFFSEFKGGGSNKIFCLIQVGVRSNFLPNSGGSPVKFAREKIQSSLPPGHIYNDRSLIWYKKVFSANHLPIVKYFDYITRALQPFYAHICRIEGIMLGFVGSCKGWTVFFTFRTTATK